MSVWWLVAALAYLAFLAVALLLGKGVDLADAEMRRHERFVAAGRRIAP